MTARNNAAMPPLAPQRERGGMLIEALVAILIFSLGILGIVGLQGTAVQQSGDARYRSEAAQLAEQLVGEMWTGNRTLADLQTQFNTCADTACPGYNAWYARVAGTLPGVTRTGATRPEVAVQNGGVVTITVRWQLPSAPAGEGPRNYVTTSQIVQQ